MSLSVVKYPQIRGGVPPSTWRCVVWWVAVTILARGCFVPANTVLDTSLDVSNFASYIRFAADQRQFGHEVVPMAGPYGFVVYGWVYGGDLYALRILLEFITKLALAALVLWFFQRTRGSVTSWGWLFANVLVLSTTPELTYDFAVLYSALFLLVERPRRGIVLSIVLFLAFLSLGKGVASSRGPIRLFESV